MPIILETPKRRWLDTDFTSMLEMWEKANSDIKEHPGDQNLQKIQEEYEKICTREGIIEKVDNKLRPCKPRFIGYQDILHPPN
jgi:hypothetical protein